METPRRFEKAFLLSRFGRRIFLMFCVAAIVPATVVFWMTYRTAVTDAQAASQRAMRANSKNFALSVFERLEAADQVLAQIDADTLRSGRAHPALTPFFSDVALLGVPQPYGMGTTGGLAARLGKHRLTTLRTTRLLVLDASTAGGRSEVILLRTVDARAGHGAVLAALLRPTFLWGNSDEFGFDGRVCVYARAQRLFCGGNGIDLHGNAAAQAEWALFLKPRFGAQAWTFVTSIEQTPTMQGYSRFLAPVAAGVLLLVLLLSSVQIRRVLVPLDALLTRIKSVGQGAVPVLDNPGPTDDEFGTLTQTFNDMGRRISGQMETLRTLSEVDRLILARVPLAAVIEVVISRIQHIVDDATITVVVNNPERSGVAEYYVRPRGSQTTEASASTLFAPVADSAYQQHPGTGQWSATNSIGPGLQSHGADNAFLFRLGRHHETQAWVSLGFEEGITPSEASLAEATELAERIAVAMAADERENQLVFQARHDPLTGLPNRLAAFEALSTAITRAKVSGESFAAVFLDLDRFKSINDGLGHAIGDKILVQAGERIGQNLRSSDFVARFGGDEFFIIVRRVSSPDHALRIMEKIADGFGAPITAEGVEFFLHFSAGIALYPWHGDDASKLINNSDVAMYRAKKLGGGRTKFFEEGMNDEAVARLQLESDLRLAIKGRQLHVHYQPRVDSRSGCIVAAEALARWTHPIKGKIAPNVFIAVAEECGLIEELGTFILDEACRQLAEWKASGFELPLIAVNVSSHQLRSGRFAQIVTNAIETSGIAWHDLEIEVTESLLIHDGGGAGKQLQQLRQRGVTVAIDDFGTGYSSLAYLAKLPTDTLKIDRAFMLDIERDTASVAVVRSIIAMAHALEKNIVAEGVESMAQVEMLQGWGCHIIQGFVYYQPLTPAAMTQELAKFSTIARDGEPGGLC